MLFSAVRVRSYSVHPEGFFGPRGFHPAGEKEEKYGPRRPRSDCLGNTPRS